MEGIQESYWAVGFTGLLAVLLWQGLRVAAAVLRRIFGVPSRQESGGSPRVVSSSLRFRTRILSVVLIASVFLSLITLFIPAVAAFGELSKLEEGAGEVFYPLFGLLAGAAFAFAALLYSLRKRDLEWDREGEP